VCLLGEERDEYDLRPYMEYLEDTGKTLPIKQVASAKMGPQFGRRKANTSISASGSRPCGSGSP